MNCKSDITIVGIFLSWLLIALAVHAGDLRVTRMTCDYRENPLGVDAAKPQLSWRMESGERGQKQTAYQVLVASSAKLLAKGEVDLWESGKVASEENIGVLYGGKTLASRQQVFWKVCVWDAAGNPSAWSSPANWTMGIFTPEAWNAKWISSPTNLYCAGPAVYLQKHIAVSKKIRRAIARYSALGWVELTIDGRKVGDAVLSPEFSDLNRRVLYLTHDVTSLLSKGSHTLDAILGNGQHSPVEPIGADEADNIVVPGGKGTGYHNRWGRFGGPKFLLELEVEYADGTCEFFGTDETWRWSSGPITFNDLWRGEKQDLRVTPTNWNPVAVFASPAGRMEVSAIPPVRKFERLPPSRIEGNKIFFDTVAAGWPRLVVKGKRGQKIIITGKVGSEFTMPPLEFALRGGGAEVLEPKFYFNVGPREMEVAGLDEPLKREQISWQVAHTDLERAGQFECSNPFFNELHRALLRTHLSYNFGQPMDASREKEAWTQDAQNMMDSAVYLTDVPAYYRNWWRDFAANQTSDGYLGAIAPIAGLQTHGWNDPWWSGMIVYLPWKFYEYCGDHQMLAEAYKPMKLYLDFLGRRAQEGVGANTGALRGRPTEKVDEAAIRDGLLAWGTGDWQGLAKPPVALTSTAAWAYYAGIVSRTAAILGHEDEARKYAKLSDEITASFNLKFFDPAAGLYAKSKNSQSAYVVPLSLGLVPDEKRSLAVARLVDAVRGATNHLNTGFVGTPFLLQCLTDVGRADLAAEIVSQRDFPGWGTLMNEGVFKENWRGEHAMMPSLGGPVGAWFYRAILGIRPDPAGPGFKRIIIKPEIVGGLMWAKGSYNSLHGKISSACAKRGERFSLRVEIPVNTTATVYLPTDFVDSIRESGRNLRSAPGVQLLRLEVGRAVLGVASGRYEFESQVK
ncbi:MAG: alpha-L-rhamnosidase N-terminal domain-containing protein [Verrucomicrobiota bacterium]